MTWKKTLKKIINGSLTELRLECRMITLKHSHDLAAALESHACRLSNLLLWNNNLGDREAAAIASALPNSPIVHLALTSNNIGVEGISKLASAIKGPKCKVRSFNVCYNPLNDAGILALSYQIKGSAITSLNLKGVNFSDQGANYLADILSMPDCKLIWLEITANPRMTNDGIVVIANAIKNNHTLLYLSLSIRHLYTNIVDINNALIRNLGIFYDTCDRLLLNHVVNSHDRERIFLQCKAITSNEARFITNISPGQHTKNLATEVIQKLQQEYDQHLVNCLDAILPTVLVNIVQIYVKEEDSQYYVSFSDRMRYNTSAEAIQALDFTHEDSIASSTQSAAVLAKEGDGELGKENVSDKTDSANFGDSSKSASYNSELGSEAQTDEEQTPINNLLADSRYSKSDYVIAHPIQLPDSKEKESPQSLLTTIFAWLKDLPEELQQQILSSFSVQQLLKFLETSLNPDKFVENQLSFESIQEKFEVEHQLYNNFTGTSQEYAQSNIDMPVPIDEYIGEQLNSDILVSKPSAHLDSYNFFGDIEQMASM
jgi:hypothetical protein